MSLILYITLLYHFNVSLLVYRRPKTAEVLGLQVRAPLGHSFIVAFKYCIFVSFENIVILLSCVREKE